MDKFDYITAITKELKSATGINFQKKVNVVLSVYYDFFHKEYETPDPYGGDDKNDGWVVEDAIFYQIYSPSQIRDSFTKDLRRKFKEDLFGLLGHLKAGRWNGKINEYIFIVNTFDNSLPKDPNRDFENIVKEAENKFGYRFSHRVCNVDYMYKLLKNLTDIDSLNEIATRLQIKSFIIPEALDERIMLKFIEDLCKGISEKYIYKESDTDFEKISPTEKIHINNLGERIEIIDACFKNLDVVANTIKLINSDVWSEHNFDRVVRLVISKYKDLAVNYNGVELFDMLCEEIQKYSPGRGFTKAATHLLVVYIFDSCDIFEKE